MLQRVGSDADGVDMPDSMTPPDVDTSERPLPHAIAARGVSTRGHFLLEASGWTGLRVGVDLLMAGIAVLAAVGGADAAGVDTTGGVVPLLALPPLVVLMLAVRGLYRRQVRPTVLDVIAPAAGAVSVAAMTVVTFTHFLDPQSEGGALIARAWLFAVLFVVAGRAALTLTQRKARARLYVARPTLIVGAGHVGAQVARRLEEHPEYGLRPVGYLDADPSDAVDAEDRRVPVLGSPEDLPWVVHATGAEHVILAFSQASDRSLVGLVRQCEALGLEVSLVPRLFESITDRVALERLGALPLFGLRSIDPKGWQFACKYALDRVMAVVALLLLSPLLLSLAAAVKFSSPGPVLFRQRRVGRDGQVFDLFKFRSMRPPRPEDLRFRPAAGLAPGGVEGVDRRTPIGRFLRRSSLDELPQLLNVLRGEMSMIGPRPERPEFVELFRRDLERYTDRHRVKSGITGWAQVHGLRGQTSLADRVDWDNFYIENWSLWLDLKIVLLTFLAVLKSGDDA